MITIKNEDVFEDIKSYNEYEYNLIFCDPPYQLGTEWTIKNGRYETNKSVDFMTKWDGMGADEMDLFFTESFRILKHGGYLIMFGMDRQLGPLYYYAAKAGFIPQQSLYWYFISNFPKASDASKNVDKKLGNERKIIGKTNGLHTNIKSSNGGIDASKNNHEDIILDITQSTSKLGKKYEGYKYSIAPLKQTCETILVFRKPGKNKSHIDDIIEAETNMTIHPSVIDVDGNRVGVDTGRYPAQTFVDSEAAKVLDEQSGGIKSSKSNNEGGCSKILNHCDYENQDYDLLNYCPKVSTKERNAGCEGFKEKKMESDLDDRGRTIIRDDGSKTLVERFGSNPQKNTHPTIKPISLITKIAKLFKAPVPMKVYVPFSGVGSECIGLANAGMEEIIGCEISDDYCKIAEARISHWCKEPEERIVNKKELGDDKGCVYRLRKCWGGKLSEEEQKKADKIDDLDDFWK